MLRQVVVPTLFAVVACEDFTTGGTLKLNWKDCGDTSTHGKVSGLSPDTLTLGQQTAVTGAGTIDEVVSGGSLEIDVTAGFIKKSFSGDLCEPKTFDLPLGTGSVTWDGLKCPVAAGSVNVGTAITLSSALPASLAKADIQIKATATNGDKVLCMQVDTAPELSVEDTCSLYGIQGDTCGQSDIDCRWVKFAMSEEKVLKEGTCESQGYTVKGSTETKKVPVIGDIVITKYTKPSLEFVTGGTLKLNWKDCGDASTHGKVSGLSPDTLTLGQKTAVTGAGSIDEVVAGGNLEIDVTAGFIKKSFSGDLCEPKTFDLPLGTGSVTWDGLKCPVAAGSVNVGTAITLSSAVPAALAKADIQIKATATSGDNMLCMQIDTAPEASAANTESASTVAAIVV